VTGPVTSPVTSRDDREAVIRYVWSDA